MSYLISFIGRFDRHKKSVKFRQVPRRNMELMPEKPDEHFYRELLFIRHETQMRGNVVCTTYMHKIIN